MRLLIVDDEVLVRRGIKSLVDFESLNITAIEEAANGLEALDKFKAFDPHLILADINMPKMDGLSFSKTVKAMNPKVKIALITGYDYFDYALQALKIGVDDYILKPVSKKDIEELLRKLIQKIEEEALDEEKEKLISNLNHDAYEGYNQDLEDVVKQEQFKSDFSLKKLSKLMGYSNNYLSSIFKKHFGMTFQDYLIHVRIEQAKILLLSTDLKNYEISEKVGFTDVNYFGSRFKKTVGMSPKEYKMWVKKNHG